jgi:hypothetical protein
VNGPGNDKGFRTLRGFLNGQEPAEANYFAYYASLRIFGNIRDLDEITQHLGIAPTSEHRQGDCPKPNSLPYKEDMWSYTVPVSENEPLHVHINELWRTFKERKDYLIQLKRDLKVDVFLGYRSNCDHAGLELPFDSLEIFIELQIPFGISIIVT